LWSKSPAPDSGLYARQIHLRCAREHKWLIAIPIAHGYLYIIYILTALQIGVQKKMPLYAILGLSLAGTLPVASFVAERRMMRRFG
jgi:integral membrane protein